MTPVEGDQAAPRISYQVVPELSTVLIQARSNVGPIELATNDITGHAEATLAAGGLDLDHPPTAAIEIPVSSLSSGNVRYDREIHRRLDAKLFPTVTAELASTRPAGSATLAVGGSLTIHGTSVSLTGNFDIEALDDQQLRIVGEQSVDIRDFSIKVPKTLMLRIYPEVLVRFRIAGTRA